MPTETAAQFFLISNGAESERDEFIIGSDISDSESEEEWLAVDVSWVLVPDPTLRNVAVADSNPETNMNTQVARRPQAPRSKKTRGDRRTEWRASQRLSQASSETKDPFTAGTAEYARWQEEQRDLLRLQKRVTRRSGKR